MQERLSSSLLCSCSFYPLCSCWPGSQEGPFPIRAAEMDLLSLKPRNRVQAGPGSSPWQTTSPFPHCVGSWQPRRPPGHPAGWQHCPPLQAGYTSQGYWHHSGLSPMPFSATVSVSGLCPACSCPLSPQQPWNLSPHPAAAPTHRLCQSWHFDHSGSGMVIPQPQQHRQALFVLNTTMS